MEETESSFLLSADVSRQHLWRGPGKVTPSLQSQDFWVAVAEIVSDRIVLGQQARLSPELLKRHISWAISVRSGWGCAAVHSWIMSAQLAQGCSKNPPPNPALACMCVGGFHTLYFCLTWAVQVPAPHSHRGGRSSSVEGLVDGLFS